MCVLVTMDTLLGKLRQHMAELSVQGDDFTRQMWQMYSAFEEFLERQNDCNNGDGVAAGEDEDETDIALHQRSYEHQRSPAAVSSTVFRSFPAPMQVMGEAAGGGFAEHSYGGEMMVDDYDLWSTMASVSRDHRTGTDIDDDENYSDLETKTNDDDETDLIKEGIRNEMERRKLMLRLESAELMLMNGAERDALNSADFHERNRRHLQYANLLIGPSLINAHLPQKPLRRHRHCQKRRRLPPTPANLQLQMIDASSTPFPLSVDTTEWQRSYSNQYHHQHFSEHQPHRYHHSSRHYQEYLDDKLTQSTPSVNMSATDNGAALNLETNDENNRCITLNAVQFGDPGIPYRRSSAPELLDNPLLETISTIEDLCESDDYGELPLTRMHFNSSHASITTQNTKESCQSLVKVSEKSENITSTSSTEERNQQSSDVDRDSVGYAGSNSVDSGYKSSCPTPELLDPCYYAQGAICNGLTSSSRRTSQMNKLSRETKPRNITMGTRAIRRQQARPSPPPTNNNSRPSSQSPLADTNSSSAGTGSGTSSPSRNSTPATETNPSSVLSSNRSPADYSYYDVNLDHLMYLRQSLLSAIQRCGIADGAKTAAESDVFLIDSSLKSTTDVTKSDLNRTASDYPSRKSWSSLDLRSQSPPAVNRDRWSLVGQDSGEEVKSLTNINVQLRNSKDEERKFGSLTSIKRDSERATGDNAEYYDLESVKDFPCSYGITIENRQRQSSLAKVKKLKDSVEQDLTALKNSHNAVKMCVTSASAIDQQQLNNSELIETPSLAKSTRSSSKLHHISDPTADSIRQHSRDDNRSKNLLQAMTTTTTGNEQSANCKSETTDDPATDRAKFSEVAICMLKIIEDIQHQQQNSVNQLSINPQINSQKPSLTNSKSKKETASETVSNIHMRPSSPAVYDSQRLSGADYHLYEEITYDLAGVTNLRPVSLVRPTTTKLDRDLLPPLSQMPPPLPARPNNIFGLNENRQPPTPAAVKRTDESGMKFGLNRARLNPTTGRRGNIYSIFTEQSDRRQLSRSLEREWRRDGRSKAVTQQLDGTDDEYGFKVLIKQPPSRETKT